MTVKNELQALKSVKMFNDLARRAAAKGSETLGLIWKAGEVAKAAKATMEHGDWMPFVEQHYEVTHRSVTRWIKFHSDIPEAKLDTVSNLTAGLKMLDPPKTDPSAGRSVSTAQAESGAVTSGPARSSAAQDTGFESQAGSQESDSTDAGSRGRGKRQSKPAAPIDREARLKECKTAISDANKLVRKVAKEIDSFECYWHEEVTRALVMAAQDVTAWINNWPPPIQDGSDPNDYVVPPEREWVETYMEQMGHTYDIDEFFDHYTSTRWRKGKSNTKAPEWKPLCRTFQRNKNKWDSEAKKNKKPSGRHRENTPLA
jgi:hypothetical protein